MDILIFKHKIEKKNLTCLHDTNYILFFFLFSFFFEKQHQLYSIYKDFIV